MQGGGVEVWVMSILNVNCKALGLANTVLSQELLAEHLVHWLEQVEILGEPDRLRLLRPEAL